MPWLDTRYFRGLAAVLAVIVAIVHLYWALPELLLQLRFGILHDPRPIAFVLLALAILTGVLYLAFGGAPRPAYLAGIVLMILLLVGYVAWHSLLSHGGFWPGRPATATHEGPLLGYVLDHLRIDRTALVSKTAEFALLVVLVLLVRRDDEA